MPNTAKVFRRISLVVMLAASMSGVAFAQAPGRVMYLEFFPDGTMTLIASGVSLRDIMAEWARTCACYVVNGDKLPAAPIGVPLEFTKVPQQNVIGGLLRQATGYALTPRRVASRTGGSLFETVYIVASSQANAAAGYAAPPPVSRPVLISTPGNPEDEIQPVQPVPSASPDTSTQPGDVEPATPGGRGAAGVAVPVVVAPIGAGPRAPSAPAPGMPTPIPQPQTPQNRPNN